MTPADRAVAVRVLRDAALVKETHSAAYLSNAGPEASDYWTGRSKIIAAEAACLTRVADDLEGMGWLPIESAPRDGREVLACFRGQFSWVMFVAHANPESHGGVFQPGYAYPSYFMELPAPPEADNAE